MIGVGSKFPEFNLKANISADHKNPFVEVSSNDYSDKWLVVFFWPKDFTFVCPTEIIGYGKYNSEFKDANTQLLGVGIDNEFCHLGWRQLNSELADSPVPMLSDVKRELSTELGILDPVEGVPQRVTYIVDPNRVIRSIFVTDLSVGRSPEETLRVLHALQSGGLCGINWKKGDDHLL